MSNSPNTLEITITVTSSDLAAIDQIADASGVSRAQLIQHALATYIKTSIDKECGVVAGPSANAENPFGFWTRRGISEDGVDFQERLRAE